MIEFGFPRLYEDGTITICKSVKGVKHSGKSKGGKQLGLRKKSFELTARKKRLIRCSAIRQFYTAKYKILFCCLTFPVKLEATEENERWANQCFSKFVENLKQNYKLQSYVSVREHENKAGSYHLHFHCLFDIPFTNFKTLNKAWNSAISDRMPFSANAFTTGKQKFAVNIKQVASYITKYIVKADYLRLKTSDIIKMSWRELLNYEIKLKEYLSHLNTRIYFIDHKTTSAPQIIDENTLIYLTTKFNFNFFVQDNYSVYTIQGFSCLPEDYVIKKPRKKEPKKKIIPDSFQPNFDF